MRIIYTLLLTMSLASAASAGFDRYGPDTRDDARYPVIEADNHA